MAKKGSPPPPVAQNKKARFKYEVLERLECGIELKGSEVKSLRSGNISLDESYCRILQGELWLLGCHIAPYENATSQGHDPLRPRKLLVHRREIHKWEPKVATQGLTIVPLDVHFNPRGLAKLTIGLVRGKTLGDKRQTLKKREHEREMARAMRRR